ncbi:MAG: protein translocase subunit SecDF [Bacteroidetes bacterium]|nr:protein translocase subunit SecDF [Bacteroidota bacterium]MBT4337104.1 protein translocase subunit SecDF [Bacteroidota bacterium]MBT6838109.1 protein translocase subunit SecDF [Bacteroidota bacterium]MBT7826871.1 protein translocase subunit SecDF [Bacteroidota bacterium]MBT7994384.1 protein translocase subunit SecDF [Bacteroidota bacterium]
MKNKGTIKFFAIALALVSIFHLSFTLKTYLVENKAKKYASEEVHWEKIRPEFESVDIEKKYVDSLENSLEKHYIDSISHKDVYNILLRKYTYSECKEREINLGLDLQGGMHVMLEVALEDLVIELSGDNQEKTFKKAIELAKKNQSSSQKDFITLFDEAVQEIDPGADLSVFFATIDNKDEIKLGAPHDKVISFLRRKATGALESTHEVLKKRIDKFGVTQPNIQLLEGTERILIELPGIDDPERIRKYLQGAAKLEFWETYDNGEAGPYILEANKVLSELLSLEDDGSTTDTTKADVKKEEDVAHFTKKSSASVNDTNGVSISDTSSISASVNDTNTAIDDTSDLANLSQDEIDKKFPLNKYLAPSVRRTDQGAYYTDGPVVGTAMFYDTVKINKYLNMPEVRQVLPPDMFFAWTANPIPTEDKLEIYQLIALKITTLDNKARLDGTYVTNARVDVSPLGEREVTLNMNNEGAKIWERMTEDNIDKSIAIVLDGLVYSFPNVSGKISGGRSSITGGFTSNEAQDLANILNSGKLDVGVNIIEEAIVGPSLGKESIRSGLASILIGLLLVLIFMVLYYNRSGWIANLALFANLFFILGVLASLGAALTLPGIAGIVLTIGMSVDANVLIFERIREEIASGKGIRMAIKEGYLKAYSSIIDANVTTLLVGIILYTFGSGPIHGFAIILIIGILSSLFSAILITRIIFDTQLNKEKVLKFSNSITENVLKKVNIDFLGKRKIAYIISGIIIIAGIASMSSQGLKYGVDFKGGFSYVIKFKEDVKPLEITGLLTAPFQDNKPEVKVFGPKNQVKLTTSFLINNTAPNVSDSIETIIRTTMEKAFPDNPMEILSTQKVGPTIADDIKISGLWSIIFSMVVIFLYIFIRFRKWQYAVAATLTPLHDVLVILAVFSIFQDILPFSLEIDQAFIAALLTIIGYSINDTVVVFDRIREKLSLIKNRPYFATVNMALNETLSRTLITSLTTLFVVFILFVFGGEVIRGFSFSLLLGIIVGTYSSIFVSTPILVEFSKKDEKKIRDKNKES